MKILGFVILLGGFLILAYLFQNLQQKLDTTPVDTQGYSASFQSALEEARGTQKKVLLIFTASWCGPCQQMKKLVYPSDPVKVQAGRFVWKYIDIDDAANRTLVEKFHIHGVPTHVIVDPMGREKKRLVGGREPDSFARWLEERP